MAMSRKHYVAVAQAVKDVRDIAKDSPSVRNASEALDLLARRLATVFQGDNGMFDRNRFLRACGSNDHDA